MKILDIRCLRGPNFWSIRHHKLVQMKLDLEDLEERPTNKIPGFYERLHELMPSLFNHYCSEGRPGGFFYRVVTGTWMGHVIEHIALELQTMAGMDCGFGRTRGTGEYGIYNVVFCYQEERAGLYTAQCVVNLVQALIDGKEYDVEKDIAALKAINEEDRLGPSTWAITEACLSKGIPYKRLDAESYVQLGYGAKQKRIIATVTSQTSAIAMDLAADKNETKRILKEAGIPVPLGDVIQHEDELSALISDYGYPLVIKPLDGNHGRGVTVNIQTYEEAINAFRRAKAHSEKLVVEQFIEGNDFRLLMIDYRLCAVALRIPARVIGDGRSTIQQLVDKTNQDPRRGTGHQNILTKIDIDNATLEILQNQDLTLDSVLPAGKELYLKGAANLSTGGTSIDLTDQIHPEVAFMAERAARAIGLDICGIDVMARDITVPLKESGAAIIEVNAGPGFRMHTHPSEGKARHVGCCVADMLFPGKENGRIPIIAITGTNGKTTTSRLTAHIARQAGYRVGFTTTDGIYIGDHLVEEGDTTGPVSAELILRDPTVEFAVLECARGGMLRAGLAFDRCDVGIVTNVAEDHLGLKDINSVEQMAKVKAIVPESVKKDGYAVLYADNDFTYEMRNRVECNVALYSLRPNNERIQAHCRSGSLVGVVQDGYITIMRGPKKIRVEQVQNIPASFGGKAPFMVENILAATLAAYCQGISVETIAQALRSFNPSAESTPGRMNTFQFKDFTVLVDYAHNPHGLAALGEYIRQHDATYRVGIITGVGDRRDEDILKLGRVAGEIFDEIIIRLDEDSRGRDQDQIVDLLTQGFREIKPDNPVRVIPEELKAIDHAIRNARPGSMIVHITEKVKRSVELVKGFKDLEENYTLKAEDVKA